MSKALSFIALGLLLAAPQGQGAGSADLEAQNERYSVRIGTVTGYPDFRTSVTVRDLEQETEAIVDFSVRALGYDEILLAPGASRAVAVGRLPRGGKALAVLDLAGNQLQDEIWCYGYSLSPNGRRLVYQTHYPRMGLPATRRSILLLYDLSRDRAGNRPPGVEGFSRGNAGIPIHPRRNRESLSHDIRLEGAYLYLEPQLWSEDSSELVFVTFSVEQKRNRLELSRFSADGGIEGAGRDIDLDSWIDWSRVGPERRAEIEQRGYPLALQGLEWGPGENSVRILPWSQEWLPEVKVLPLPEIP